ncbi:MAG: exonuclease domain-containing protein [Bacteroidota bacterium]
METLQNYTAIDFETAHPKHWSICQIGLVRVENGIITRQINGLVKPPDNFYWSKFTEIHGINAFKTLRAPTFEQVWKFIEPYISNQNVVAHNGFGFDFHCLDKVLDYYDIKIPQYNRYCTYKIYKNNLPSLCKEYDIPLNHHDALSDALACAKLFMMHQKAIA